MKLNTALRVLLKGQCYAIAAPQIYSGEFVLNNNTSYGDILINRFTNEPFKLNPLYDELEEGWHLINSLYPESYYENEFVSKHVKNKLMIHLTNLTEFVEENTGTLIKYQSNDEEELKLYTKKLDSIYRDACQLLGEIKSQDV